MMFYKLFLLFLLCTIFTPFSLEAYEDSIAPWDFNRRETGDIQKKEISPPAAFLKSGVTFFTKYISPVDGDRCPMYPTCAAYSREAIEKYGFLYGMLMTVDRLIHEGNEMDTAPVIKVYNRFRFLDPVSNNYF